MALDSTDLAVLTARSGAGRSGAFRSGFAPKFVEGDTPGSDGPFYGWHEEAPPVTAWTPADEVED
jgi:hypothetical protein